jgi:glycosyltransferase involved in cell wall biosynthesis
VTGLSHSLLRGLTAVHFAALAGLAFYGIHRLWLVAQIFRIRRRGSPPFPPPIETSRSSEQHPLVTVQIPIFNEPYVAGRVIDAASRIDWPAERLEIQVLDDSTDETRRIVDERVAHWAARGVPMVCIRRPSRDGFKAGALAHGTARARGEFVAVFDADFLPEPDFLRRSMSVFNDSRIGMVQARWGYVNRDHSWMTRVQALFLDAHFRIEHQVRFARGLFFNFNGTAGVWRRRAIEDAGGWQAATITEDLDLSYRAQLRGWRFAYIDDLVVPSELPATLGAYRMQQRRWAKGSIQTARKILPRIGRARLPAATKLEAAIHLLGNIGWLLGAVLVVTLYPAVRSRAGIGIHDLLRLDIPLLLGSSGAILFYFAIAGTGAGLSKRIRDVMLVPVLSVGLAPAVAAAVMEGVLFSGGIFDRTPKFGLRGKARLPRHGFVCDPRSLSYTIVNGLLFIYACMPIAVAVQRATWAGIPFLLLYPLGFAAYLIQDLRALQSAVSRDPRQMPQDESRGIGWPSCEGFGPEGFLLERPVHDRKDGMALRLRDHVDEPELETVHRLGLVVQTELNAAERLGDIDPTVLNAFAGHRLVEEARLESVHLHGRRVDPVGLPTAHLTADDADASILETLEVPGRPAHQAEIESRDVLVRSIEDAESEPLDGCRLREDLDRTPEGDLDRLLV